MFAITGSSTSYIIQDHILSQPFSVTEIPSPKGNMDIDSIADLGNLYIANDFIPFHFDFMPRSISFKLHLLSYTQRLHRYSISVMIIDICRSTLFSFLTSLVLDIYAYSCTTSHHLIFQPAYYDMMTYLSYMMFHIIIFSFILWALYNLLPFP